MKKSILILIISNFLIIGCGNKELSNNPENHPKEYIQTGITKTGEIETIEKKVFSESGDIMDEEAFKKLKEEKIKKFKEKIQKNREINTFSSINSESGNTSNTIDDCSEGSGTNLHEQTCGKKENDSSCSGELQDDSGSLDTPKHRFNINNTPDLKPIIYLYPTHTQDIKVQLNYKGTLIADYPVYNKSINGWLVTAYPDGKIINKEDEKEYSYLFWEGIPNEKVNRDLSTGFVVKGEDTREFLQEKLAQIGLAPKEYNEFIVYWYPKMKDNKYNLVHFAETQYTDIAPLTIIPKPDSMLRVFMVFKPLDVEIKISEQKITPFERTGFSVIEWGGTELK